MYGDYCTFRDDESWISASDPVLTVGIQCFTFNLSRTEERTKRAADFDLECAASLSDIRGRRKSFARIQRNRIRLTAKPGVAANTDYVRTQPLQFRNSAQ